MRHRAIKPTGQGKGSYKKERQHKQGERFKRRTSETAREQRKGKIIGNKPTEPN